MEASTASKGSGSTTTKTWRPTTNLAVAPNYGTATISYNQPELREGHGAVCFRDADRLALGWRH
jgi:hypothetical protein